MKTTCSAPPPPPTNPPTRPGWSADPSTGNYNSLIEHGTGGAWTIQTTPNPGTSANGFAGITAIPSGGVWAVGNTASNGNNATLIAYHC